MHILPVKKTCLCYVHYYTIEIIFEINIAIYHSYLFVVPNFSFWYFLRYPDDKKQKLRCEWAREIKKKIIILEGFIKQPVKKQNQFLLNVFFFFPSLTAVWVFFSFLSKRF